MESTTISVRPPFCLTTIVPSRLCGGSYPRPQALSPRKYQMCRDIFRSDRTPLILVWAKNMQPSNVSGMDGRASAISKHVPQGNILLLGQTRYYALEETSCLFRWADPLTTVTYSLSPVKRSPRHPQVLFLSLYIHIHILFPPWFYVLNMYWFRNFTYTPPRFFAPSLAHRTRQPYNPLQSLLQRVLLRSPSTAYSRLRPHSLSTQSQYSLHYLFLPFHRHTHHRTSFHSLPFHTNL